MNRGGCDRVIREDAVCQSATGDLRGNTAAVLGRVADEVAVCHGGVAAPQIEHAAPVCCLIAGEVAVRNVGRGANVTDARSAPRFAADGILREIAVSDGRGAAVVVDCGTGGSGGVF